MADWEDVRTERKNEGGKDFFCGQTRREIQMSLLYSFVMAFTSFKMKVAFNIFNQYLKEKLGWDRGKTETGGA